VQVIATLKQQVEDEARHVALLMKKNAARPRPPDPTYKPDAHLSPAPCEPDAHFAPALYEPDAHLSRSLGTGAPWGVKDGHSCPTTEALPPRADALSCTSVQALEKEAGRGLQHMVAPHVEHEELEELRSRVRLLHADNVALHGKLRAGTRQSSDGDADGRSPSPAAASLIVLPRTIFVRKHLLCAQPESRLCLWGV